MKLVTLFLALSILPSACKKPKEKVAKTASVSQDLDPSGSVEIEMEKSWYDEGIELDSFSQFAVGPDGKAGKLYIEIKGISIASAACEVSAVFVIDGVEKTAVFYPYSFYESPWISELVSGCFSSNFEYGAGMGRAEIPLPSMPKKVKALTLKSRLSEIKAPRFSESGVRVSVFLEQQKGRVKVYASSEKNFKPFPLELEIGNWNRGYRPIEMGREIIGDEFAAPTESSKLYRHTYSLALKNPEEVKKFASTSNIYITKVHTLP